MFISTEIQTKLFSQGFLGSLILKILEGQENHSDGEMLSWRYIPVVNSIQVCDEKTIRDFIECSALNLIDKVFQSTPGFEDLAKQLNYQFFHECRQAFPIVPFNTYKDRMSNHSIRFLSEAGFWITKSSRASASYRLADVFIAAAKVNEDLTWDFLDNMLSNVGRIKSLDIPTVEGK